MDNKITVYFEKGMNLASVYGLYQWDYGQVLEIKGVEVNGNVWVQFAMDQLGGNAVPVVAEVKEDSIIAEIPSFVFEKETTRNYNAYAFVYVSNETSGETIKVIKLNIKARPKPEDYVYTEEEKRRYDSLEERVKDLEEKGTGGSSINVDSELSETSENPVQNKVVAKKVYELSKEIVHYITPEMFGAKGDGITDDTVALKSMITALQIENKPVYIPQKTYRISEKLHFQNINFLRMLCDGIFKWVDFDTMPTSIKEMVTFENCDYLQLMGFHIDANTYYTRCVNLYNCKNAVLENPIVENVGRKDYGDDAVWGISVRYRSHNCLIKNPRISKVYSNSVSTGIYFVDGENKGVDLPENCTVMGGLIEDIYPSLDSDGIKILCEASLKDANLKVTNCTMIDCRKRGLKFQARGCHSLGNTIIFNETTAIAAIDFQRGYGTSENDTVISNFMGSPEHSTDGYIRDVVACYESHNTVLNLKYMVTNTDNSFATNETGAGSLVRFGSLRSAWETDEEGNYIEDANGKYILSDCAVAEYNIVKGIHGNGVSKGLIGISFEGSIVDESKINGSFMVRHNVVEDVEIGLLAWSAFPNVHGKTVPYKIHRNDFKNIKIKMYNNSTTNGELLIPPSYSSFEFRYNVIELHLLDTDVVESPSINIGNTSTEFIHFNKVRITGAYRMMMNIDSADYVQIRNENKESPYKNRVNRVRFYYTSNPQNISSAGYRGLGVYAKVGDECVNISETMTADENGVIRGWVCVSEPNTDYPVGQWIPMYV